MNKIIVSLSNNKKVKAYKYTDNVLLIHSGLVYDSDSLIVTDENGFRYKRKAKLDESIYSNVFYTFVKI